MDIKTKALIMIIPLHRDQVRSSSRKLEQLKNKVNLRASF